MRAIKLLGVFVIAACAGAQTAPKFMGREVVTYGSGRESDSGPAPSPARLCIEGPPQQQCYSAPKDFGWSPTVEVVRFAKDRSALLFSASTGGVSGWGIHYALLAPDAGNELEDLFLGDVSVSNQNRRAFWSEPDISDAKINYYIASTYLYATSSTHVSVLKDSTGYPAACGTGPAVWVRQTQVQLVTGSDVPITTSQPVAESFSGMTSNTCTPNYGQPVPSACAATSSGVFLDTQSVAGIPNNPSGFCVSETPAGCGFSLTSTWAACGSGLANNIWTSPRVVHNNSNTMNGNTTGFPTGTQLYP